MRVVVCAMAKNEQLYINEWVGHYVKLGFDTLYIFDNDDTNKKPIKSCIDKKYLDKVVVVDIRGITKPKLQQETYTNFYRDYRNTFDWVFFCDIDEFLVGVDNVKEWLSNPMYNKALQIRVMWKLFGDNELIERDMSKGVMETFTKQVHSSLHRNLQLKGNLEIQGKAFVSGGIDNVVVRSPHFASIGYRDNLIPSILPSGKPCHSFVAIVEDYSKETIWLNHYMTKSLKEFIDQKLKRTDAVYGDKIPLTYYFRINKITNEKLEYLRKLGLEM